MVAGGCASFNQYIPALLFLPICSDRLLLILTLLLGLVHTHLIRHLPGDLLLNINTVGAGDRMATGGRHVLVLLLIDVFGNLMWFLLADLLRFIHTNLTWNILALLPWNILAILPWDISAFLSRDILAGLAGFVGARLGRNLRTLGLRNINAHLAWDTLLNLVHHIFAHHGW